MRSVSQTNRSFLSAVANPESMLTMLCVWGGIREGVCGGTHSHTHTFTQNPGGWGRYSYL